MFKTFSAAAILVLSTEAVSLTHNTIGQDISNTAQTAANIATAAGAAAAYSASQAAAAAAADAAAVAAGAAAAGEAIAPFAPLIILADEEPTEDAPVMPADDDTDMPTDDAPVMPSGDDTDMEPKRPAKKCGIKLAALKKKLMKRLFEDMKDVNDTDMEMEMSGDDHWDDESGPSWANGSKGPCPSKTGCTVAEKPEMKLAQKEDEVKPKMKPAGKGPNGDDAEKDAPRKEGADEKVKPDGAPKDKKDCKKGKKDGEKADNKDGKKKDGKKEKPAKKDGEKPKQEKK